MSQSQSGKEWYAEQLKHPLWQRRRLEAMQAADFKCEYCGNAEKTLHIHHLKYTGKPWEAPLSDLECLCETHHNMREQNNGMPCLFVFKNTRAARVAIFSEAVLAAFGRSVKLEAIVKAISELPGGASL